MEDHSDWKGLIGRWAHQVSEPGQLKNALDSTNGNKLNQNGQVLHFGKAWWKKSLMNTHSSSFQFDCWWCWDPSFCLMLVST